MNVIEHITQRVLVPINVFGIDISITNESLVLWLAVLLICLFFYSAGRDTKLVPKRLQNAAELYIDTLWEYIGPALKDRSMLPFFVALFSLILFCNLLGQLPGSIPPTANINFTATLAVIVFFFTHAAGIRRNGVKRYFKSFMPEGIPLPLQAFIFPLEVVSQLVRPFSLAIRLFANIFVGHAVMLSIISLIFIFRSLWVVPGTILGEVMISAFELLVALIQAFVFTFLSAFYVGSALDPEHS